PQSFVVKLDRAVGFRSSRRGLYSLQALLQRVFHEAGKHVVSRRNGKRLPQASCKRITLCLAGAGTDNFQQEVRGIPPTPGPLAKDTCDSADRRHQWHELARRERTILPVLERAREASPAGKKARPRLGPAGSRWHQAWNPVDVIELDFA